MLLQINFVPYSKYLNDLTMKEEFLYYVWKYRLYNTKVLQTVQGDAIEIIQPGRRNTSSGPDFLESQIKIGTMMWVGNVEIHVRSSDWNLHKHHEDKAYNNVILHVVFDSDTEIQNQKGKTIPTLELKERIQSPVWENYQKFLYSHYRFIPCEKVIPHLEHRLIENHFKTRLLIERFEEKVKRIERKLELTQNNWEAVLFILLAKYFGTKLNRDAMEYFAQSFDFTILKKCSHKKEQLEALLFGQAGFLEGMMNDEYSKNLQKEYRFLQSKFKLEPCEASIFKFYGVRPPNYITIRLAQLAALYYEYQNIFSFLIKIKKRTYYYPLFEVKITPYWETHYHFGKKSSKRSEKQITKDFIDIVLINVIIPIQYCYEKQRGVDTIEKVEEILCKIPPEKNTITQNFKTINTQLNSAWDSQALIQLKTAYCNEKKCLNCEIGNKLLRKNNGEYI